MIRKVRLGKSFDGHSKFKAANQEDILRHECSWKL